MNETREQDQDIQEALRMSLINEEPSEALLRELRVLASKVAPSKRPWWKPSLAIGGTIAAACGIFALILTPTRAKAYDSIIAAASQQNTFQLAVDSTEDGIVKRVNIMGVDGKFTIRGDDGGLVQFDKGTMRVYDAKENTITQIKMGGIVDPQMIGKAVQSGISEGLKQMDLKKTLREYEEKYGKDHIKISTVTREDGRDIYHVTMDSPKESERVKMLVDANTDLPERIDVEGKDSDGSVKHDSTIRLQFGAQIDPKLMAPDFPKNAKVIDIDLGALMGGALQGVGESLKGLGPMIEQSLKGVKDPQVNLDLGSNKGD